jgi:acetyl esterase/lipase
MHIFMSITAGSRILRILIAAMLLLATATAPAHGATVKVTASYGSESEQQIDITYDPSKVRRPWVMVIHGGSWAAGDRAASAGSAARFATEGFVVFNIDYRKISDFAKQEGVAWEQQMEDVLAAVNWVRAHATEYGAVANRGAVYGFSAGGHLAAIAGLHRSGKVQAIVSASGVLQPHRLISTMMKGGPAATPMLLTAAGWTQVAMRCPMVAWTDCAARWKAFKPETYIRTDSPPMMMFQGTADPGVPPETVKGFKYWLDAAGVENIVIEGVGWGHTEGLAMDGGARQKRMMDWLKLKTA